MRSPQVQVVMIAAYAMLTARDGVSFHLSDEALYLDLVSLAYTWCIILSASSGWFSISFLPLSLKAKSDECGEFGEGGDGDWKDCFLLGEWG